MTLAAANAVCVCSCLRVQEVAPAAGRQLHKLSFQLVYPDRNGRPMVRNVGSVFTWPAPNAADENKTLASVQFETGDYLSVCIMEQNQRR